jgi:hypothetical protein
MQLIMGETSQKSDLLLAILTHLFSLLVGLAAVGVCAWVVATGQLFTLDGLLLVAVSGAIATFFVGNTAWAVYTGELRELLAQMRSKSEAAAPEAPPEKP